jgi:hypothetical protein
MVYRLAVPMLRNESDADDAGQEVFLSMHRSLDGFDASRPLRPWVARVSYNACLRRLRGAMVRATTAVATSRRRTRICAACSNLDLSPVCPLPDHRNLPRFYDLFVFRHESGAVNLCRRNDHSIGRVPVKLAQRRRHDADGWRQRQQLDLVLPDRVLHPLPGIPIQLDPAVSHQLRELPAADGGHPRPFRCSDGFASTLRQLVSIAG